MESKKVYKLYRYFFFLTRVTEKTFGNRDISTVISNQLLIIYFYLVKIGNLKKIGNESILLAS